MGTPYDKTALTFAQQLDLLRSRGLTINDPIKARRALSRISYYRLSAYWHPFKKSDNSFEEGATFEEALRLYEFDRHLRLLVLDGIERVEVHTRTLLTYELAHTYHPFAHGDPASFDDTFNHQDWHDGLLEEIGRAKERFLEHFREKYDGYPRVPIWMASEVMSLGTLSRMFQGMRTEVQSKVASEWGVHQSVAGSWLHAISSVRNICAHHARLWNRELGIKPKLPRNRVEWSTLGNRRVYAILCILRQLTRNDHGGDRWADSARSLLSEMIGHVRWQNAMGVPQDWAKQVFWR